ncbi:MAG: response regulator transcription factor [Desulfuromonadales bacterium]
MRVAIVEDDSVTRETLKLLLANEPQIDAVQAFESGETFLGNSDNFDTDVLLVDLDLPGMHGTELIEKVKRERPELDILVYTIYEDRENVFAAIKAGASGYILKGRSARDLIDSLLVLQQGGAPMSPRIARKVLGEFQKIAVEENPLSPKENRIIRYIEEGLTYNIIAERLGISPHTVHNHIKNIYGKLHAGNRVEALNRARKIGIL